jgi:gluconokinase
MTKLFLAVDVGTTNVRSIIFNQKGRVVSQAYRTLTTFTPKSEIAEQDPEAVWKLTVETMRDAVKSLNTSANRIETISFSARMHGTMMIDRKGKPITRLLTWLDRRAMNEVGKVHQLIDPYELYTRTGCPLLYIYPFVKILWINKHWPQRFNKCYKILSVKDYVLYKMIAKSVIDRSVASGTQLLNIHTLNWDDTLLEMVNITQDMLPTLANETDIIGEVSRDLAKATGLSKGIPIIPGASDGALNNIGLGATVEGVAAMNLGTSGALRILADKPLLDAHPTAHFFCYYAALGKWLPGGAISNAGILLRWFRDNFGHQEIEEAKKRRVNPYFVISEKVGIIKPSADGLLMLPFFSGERFPVRDPQARGVLFGLTLSHTKAHVARAIYESVIFTLRWIMENLEEHAAQIHEVRVGGGGARSRVWRQIQADVLGKPIVHTQVEESSALGAAMLGTISSGIYSDLTEATQNMITTIDYQEPEIPVHEQYSNYFELFKELYYVSQKIFEQLTKIETKR